MTNLYAQSAELAEHDPGPVPAVVEPDGPIQQPTRADLTAAVLAMADRMAMARALAAMNAGDELRARRWDRAAWRRTVAHARLVFALAALTEQHPVPVSQPVVRPCARCGEKQVADGDGGWDHDVVPAPGSPCAGHGPVPIPTTIQWPEGADVVGLSGVDLSGCRAVCWTCSRTLVVVDGYAGAEWVHELGGGS